MHRKTETYLSCCTLLIASAAVSGCDDSSGPSAYTAAPYSCTVTGFVSTKMPGELPSDSNFQGTASIDGYYLTLYPQGATSLTYRLGPENLTDTGVLASWHPVGQPAGGTGIGTITDASYVHFTYTASPTFLSVDVTEAFADGSTVETSFGGTCTPSGI